MLNPRVVNFKCAPPNICYKRGNISNDQVVSQTINSHFFNFSVSLVVADCMAIPEKLIDVLTVDSSFYKLLSVPLDLLISQDFIEYFIQAGEVTALSVNTLLDSDNCLVITPGGHLILSVDYRTYQELGLIKGPAIDVRKNKNSFVVIVDLKKGCFKIGNKNYDKAYENVSRNSNIKFDLLLAWEPNDSKVCPSSIAKYFTRHGSEVKECFVEDSKRISYSVKFPLLTAEEDELFEWFGAFLFNLFGQNQDEGEEFIVFDQPEPYEDIGQVVLMSWTGLFTRKRLIKFFEEMKYVAFNSKEVPWVGCSVLGYLDTPVAWGLCPHVFRTSGENDYTILMNHEGDYAMCKNTETLSIR